MSYLESMMLAAARHAVVGQDKELLYATPGSACSILQHHCHTSLREYVAISEPFQDIREEIEDKAWWCLEIAFRKRHQRTRRPLPDSIYIHVVTTLNSLRYNERGLSVPS